MAISGLFCRLNRLIGHRAQFRQEWPKRRQQHAAQRRAGVYIALFRTVVEQEAQKPRVLGGRFVGEIGGQRLNAFRATAFCLLPAGLIGREIVKQLFSAWIAC